MGILLAIQTIFQPQYGAGEGNRTLVISLEGFSSTIELHPRNPTTRSTAQFPTPTYSMTFSHYEEVPKNVSEEIQEKHSAKNRG